VSKEFKNITLFDIQFCLTDDDGNILLNDDYTAKLFTPRDDYNLSHIAEYFDHKDIKENNDG